MRDRFLNGRYVRIKFLCPACTRGCGILHARGRTFVCRACAGYDYSSRHKDRAGQGQRQAPARHHCRLRQARGYRIIDQFYDAAVSGSDPIAERPGFKAMLDRIAHSGVRFVLVESPDRFARDLTIQLTCHDYLKSLGVELIPASAPDFFVEDTPIAVLVRQALGAIAQFEKASLVAKLKAARDRKKALTGKGSGRKTLAEARPEAVALAKQLHIQGLSLRQISAALAARGYLTSNGKPYVASSMQRMLEQRKRLP